MCVLSEKLLEKLRNIALKLNFSVRMNRILPTKIRQCFFINGFKMISFQYNSSKICYFPISKIINDLHIKFI